MFGPPALMPHDLADLIASLGGKKAAARLLGAQEAQLDQWLTGHDAPQMVLRLLWYAGSDGRYAAEIDLANELRAIACQRDAVVEDSQRRRALIDERSSALAARVKALEHENRELRHLLTSDGLAAEVATMRKATDRFLRVLALTGSHDVQQKEAS